MDRSKALFDFNFSSDDVLSTQGRAIAAALTNNPYFPEIGQVLTNMQADYKAYAAALDTARVGSPSEKAAKNVAKGVFLSSLHTTCDYVNLKATGNRPALLTTGFTISREFQGKRVIKEVTNFTVTDGALGQAKLSMQAQPTAKSSFFARSTGIDAAGNITWKTLPGTRCEFVFENLPLGEVISFQAGYVGARNQVVYSPVLTLKIR